MLIVSEIVPKQSLFMFKHSEETVTEIHLEADEAGGCHSGKKKNTRIRIDLQEDLQSH